MSRQTVPCHALRRPQLPSARDLVFLVLLGGLIFSTLGMRRDFLDPLVVATGLAWLSAVASRWLERVRESSQWGSPLPLRVMQLDQGVRRQR
ncbi:MAG: hypothetical protein QM756_02120 [Polyangiaceae bacterium]